VRITQSSLDGLQALIQWCDGFKHRHDVVPGSFELVMFYRELRHSIEEHLTAPAQANSVANLCGKASVIKELGPKAID
jgi:hypothetical protein